MASPTTTSLPEDLDLPCSDGRPMAETPIHRANMVNAIFALQQFYAENPDVYVSGNMFLHYFLGDRRMHVSPDVQVTLGVPKLPERRSYIVWREGKAPDLVIEFTSASTREEDIEDKYTIYQDKLKVQEYFLFDPEADYLKPPLQGYRLIQGQYVRIEPVAGRLPSAVLGLHLEAAGQFLRFHDPATGQWLLTPEEEAAARRQAEAEQARAEARLAREAEARRQAEAEVAQLRRELEALRGKPPQPGA